MPLLSMFNIIPHSALFCKHFTTLKCYITSQEFAVHIQYICHFQQICPDILYYSQMRRLYFYY